ncbi:hypothetical protein IH575_03110 [Candidatus Dojkabacteria bacterium]|nr:hypothetical protein [Candidatus Dojkabacteria bacterium]
MTNIKFLSGILLFVAGTITILKIQAQNQFYSADRDNPTGNYAAIKKGYIVEKINDTSILWGLDTVRVANFKAFTKAEFSRPDFNLKILFVKNEIEPSLYINNKTGKTLLTSGLQDSIKSGYFKLKNITNDTFTLHYNDSVTLVRSNGNKLKAFVTIPLFFNKENLQVENTIKRGIDSLVVKMGEKYLYRDKEVELTYCYTNSFLAKIITDSTLFYIKEYSNKYLIFDADNITSKEIKTSAVLQWLQSGLNWLWLVIGLIVIGGIVFVLVLSMKNNKFIRKPKTKESENIEKVKFLHKKDKKKAVFQLTIKDNNKNKLIKELSIEPDDIKKTDNIIEVTITLKEEECRIGQDLQNLEKWVKNRCSVELFYKINDISDYNELKKGRKYLVLKQSKLAILEKYAENPTPKQDIEKLDMICDKNTSNYKIPESEIEAETYTQPTEVIEKKTNEEPIIDTLQFNKLKQQSLSGKLQAFLNMDILKDEDETKIKETLKRIKSFLLELQTDIDNTESKYNSAIDSYSQQIEEFKKEHKKKIAGYKTAMEIEKENAVKQAEEKIINEYSGKASEKENKLHDKIKEKETEIANLKESHKNALSEKEEENKKKIEKIKENNKADLAKKDEKINEIKREKDEIKEKTEKEWKVKLEQKENAFNEEQKKRKADVERLTKAKTDAIAEEKEAGETAVKAEQEKAKRYHENVIFADELKPYAGKVLSLLEMGHNLQVECDKIYTKEKNNTNANAFLNKTFAKFTTETFYLKIGDWREQLNNIVYNGTLIVPPAGKENNHSSVYATIRQAIKENRSKEQRIEAFQKNIAIALLNRYCGSLLVLVEDMKVLAVNKISIPKLIDELRKTLRLHITKELSLKINDIDLLEKLNNNGEIEVIDEIVSSLTKDNERVVEVLFYGVGRDRVDKTKVIISK